MSDAGEKHDKPQPDEDGSFLQRWSRRKLAAAHDEPAKPEAAETEAQDRACSSEASGSACGETPAAPTSEADSNAGSEPDPPGDEDMPPLESIDRGGGVEAFFSTKVSASLRRAALRRLFSQPEFGGPDMLEEYSGDYSKPAPLGDIVTADMRYRIEQARKLAERKLKAAMESKTRPEVRPARVQEAGAEADTTGTPTDAQVGQEKAHVRDGDSSDQLAKEDANPSDAASPDEADHEPKST